MVAKLTENPSVRLLKHIVRCYLRLSEHPRAKDALRQCLPDALRDQSFAAVLRSEESVQRWLAHLLKNLSEQGPPTASPSLAPAANSAAARAGMPSIPALPAMAPTPQVAGGFPQFQQAQAQPQQSAWNM
jgi:Cell differentiation family, Rcd1-like